MTDLKQLCDRLKYLGSQAETPEARAEVEAAFALKWEGVQAVAARVLGHWGGRRSVDLIKHWLLDYYQNGESALGIEKVATDALRECIEPQDTPWILDVYFNELRLLYFDAILFAVRMDTAQERILSECKHSNPAHRQQALLAMVTMKFPDVCQYLDDFQNDPAESVSYIAKYTLAYLCP